MEHFEILLKGSLTSHSFYNQVLSELHEFYLNREKKQVVINFSEVTSIDALVVPNLLCVGYIIKITTGIAPFFLIPHSIQHSKIKKYLIDIEFYSLARKFELFEFDDYFDCGLEGYKINDINKTIYIDGFESDVETYSKLTKLFSNFKSKQLVEFANYNVYSNNDNDLVYFCMEMVINAKKHGKSFCFLTVQYNDYLKRMLISLSDCGIGFKRSLLDNGDVSKKNDDFSEFEGIIHGLFKRRDSEIYGLYNILDKISSNNGVMRVHSMDTQIIFTKYLFSRLKNNEFSDIYTFDKNFSLSKNVRNNLKYKGVHIEIELPITDIR